MAPSGQLSDASYSLPKSVEKPVIYEQYPCRFVASLPQGYSRTARATASLNARHVRIRLTAYPLGLLTRGYVRLA